MRLANLVYEKRMLKRKIDELKIILKYDNSENIIQELFVQLELLQAKKVNLNTVNSQVKIDLGGKEVVVSTAIVIRDVMKEKMNILTGLIINNDCKLDKLELMRRRDDIYEEVTLLSNKILANDLSIKIGD